jgi:pyridoxal 5'-phosphate synthase pdxT subunit
MVVGILAVQGNFARHQQVLAQLGAETLLVRTAEELNSCDRLVLPGGESSVFLHHLSFDFLEQLRTYCANHAVFATCAGLILLAKQVLNPAQESLELLDVTVVRNAYGRQADSFFTNEVALTSSGAELVGKHAAVVNSISGAFIRAPQIKEVHSERVAVLATHQENPVLVLQDRLLAATFHPELAQTETRVHKLFLEL